MKKRIALGVVTAGVFSTAGVLLTAPSASAIQMWSWCEGGNRYVVTDNGDGTYGYGVVYDSNVC